MIRNQNKTEVSNSMIKYNYYKRITIYTRDSQERKTKLLLLAKYVFHIEYQKTKTQIQKR